MHASPLQGVIDHLRRLTDPNRRRELCDADLLERFRLHREESAFTLLVQRHGPLVLNVCRRILGDVHEAEDAFQATFLVLVRKADTIHRQQSLAGWLHRVALRLALKARAQSARRQRCEREVLPPAMRDNSFDALATSELRAALDEEIERLPDKYRMPLVLCYLAEKTHEQAAHELGWPKSTVTARLAKARELLQRRLIRRGFTAPAGLLTVLLIEATANATIPATLTLSTVHVAMQSTIGQTLAATASVALADGFAKGSALIKWLVSLTLLTTLGFAATVGHHLASTGSPAKQAEPPPKAQPLGEPQGAKVEPRKPRLDLQGDPLPDGVLARMGSGRMRHAWLRAMSYSSDGKTLVSMNPNGTFIWDTSTGELLRRFDLKPGNELKSFRLTNDGIVRAMSDGKGIVTVQVVDVATGKIRRGIRIKEPAVVYDTPLSPDGKRVALAHKNGIVLYDTTSGDKTTPPIPVKGIAPCSIAFAPDGKTLAHSDILLGTIYLHDIASGKLIREMNRSGDTTLVLVFSPDGRFLASMSQSRITEKGEVSIWNVREGKEAHRMTHPFRFAVSAAFSLDGKLLAIGGGRWGLVLWNVETGKEVRRLSPHGGVLATTFSPDGKILATGSPRGAIRLWDTATGKLLPASADADLQFANSLRFSADGKRLFADAGACLVWDSPTGREVRRFADPEAFDFSLPNDLRCLVLSPDESLLVAAKPDGTISVWDATTGEKKQVLKGHQGRTWKLAFTPDSRRLISNGTDERIRVWDVASGRMLHNLFGRTCLDVSPDSRQIAATDAKDQKKPTNIVVYELASGRETKRFPFATEGNVLHLAFSPDSRCIAAAGTPRRTGRFGAVKIWEIESGRLLRTLELPETVFWQVAFSPDGRSVATSGSSLLLWELASGKQRHRFTELEDPIRSFAFSPDGRTLAASSVDAPVFVWDVAGSLEPKPRRLSKDELQRAWIALAGEDAAVAFQTVRRLAAVPEQTLPLLRQHLKPVPAPDLKRVRQLVQDLDSEDFPTRQKATEELEKHADTAVSLLREILAKEKPTLEVRKRLQQILDGLDDKPEALRTVRAVEILEWIGSPDAVRFLDELAKGTAEARLTREASAAKRRLAH